MLKNTNVFNITVSIKDMKDLSLVTEIVDN